MRHPEHPPLLHVHRGAVHRMLTIDAIKGSGSPRASASVSTLAPARMRSYLRLHFGCHSLRHVTASARRPVRALRPATRLQGLQRAQQEAHALGLTSLVISCSGSLRAVVPNGSVEGHADYLSDSCRVGWSSRPSGPVHMIPWACDSAHPTKACRPMDYQTLNTMSSSSPAGLAAARLKPAVAFLSDWCASRCSARHTP